MSVEDVAVKEIEKLNGYLVAVTSGRFQLSPELILATAKAIADALRKEGLVMDDPNKCYTKQLGGTIIISPEHEWTNRAPLYPASGIPGTKEVEPYCRHCHVNKKPIQPEPR